MRAYWRLFRRETPLLTYGVSLTFLSSVGQTFLVSLFVPHFLEAFALSEGQFGLLYSGATLGSASLLPWAGKRMDREHLHRFTLAVAGLLAASAFLVAGAWHVAVLGLALLGVRLGGQGLSSHTALTAMARYYRAARGRALSVSNLGFPLGEAVLPLALTGVIAAVGWRWTWAGLGAGVLLAAPLLVRLLRRSGVELDPRKVGGAPEGQDGNGAPRDGPPAAGGGSPDRVGDEGPGVRDAGDVGAPSSDASPADDWTRREVLGDPTFWCALPAALLPAFWITGFFLYQTSIARAQGWSAALMASAFVAFAAARVVFILGTGGGVDRYSARRLFPFTVLPMGVGIGLLWAAEAPWAAHGFMALLGVSMGMSGSLQTALWAELYGTLHLGAIRSMLASMTVVSTAASPPVVGFAVEAGGLDGLLAAGVASVAVGALLALKVLPGRTADRPARR